MGKQHSWDLSSLPKVTQLSDRGALTLALWVTVRAYCTPLQFQLSVLPAQAEVGLTPHRLLPGMLLAKQPAFHSQQPPASQQSR